MELISKYTHIGLSVHIYATKYCKISFKSYEIGHNTENVVKFIVLDITSFSEHIRIRYTNCNLVREEMLIDTK